MDVTSLLKSAQARLAAMTPEERRQRSRELAGVPEPAAKPCKACNGTGRKPPRRHKPGGMVAAALAAARSLAQPFTAEQLAVQCWHTEPKLFGMAGYGQFPDLHKVWALLSGKRGLVGRGLLVRYGPKLYRVAEGTNGG